VNTHAAPTELLSCGPPTMAVLPSADSATARPCAAKPTAPLPTSLFPCWVQTPPLRVNTHAAPAEEPRGASLIPPTRAVLPSADDATESPCWAGPAAPVPTSLLPCWVHTPPLRVNTHTAPAPPPSRSRPTMTVLPSTDTATGKSWVALEPTPLPTSLGPCCTKSASEGCAGPSSAAAAITAMAPPRPRRTPRRLAKSNQRASSEVARPHFASAHEIVSAIGCIRPLQRAQTR